MSRVKLHRLYRDIERIGEVGACLATVGERHVQPKAHQRIYEELLTKLQALKQEVDVPRGG